MLSASFRTKGTEKPSVDSLKKKMTTNNVDEGIKESVREYLIKMLNATNRLD